jgi:thiamine kinase-like enzyme
MHQAIETISREWLSEILNKPVAHFTANAEASHWSNQVLLTVHFAGGDSQALRLKICLGDTFGRSEVDYYTRDYLGLPNAPLVRCYDAQFEPGVGYHLLLEDLAETHHNRLDVPPTREYGLTIAEALGRMHRHHAQTQPVPNNTVWERYFAEIRPGIVPMETATGQKFAARFDVHEKALRQRWADPLGMSLLHGDLNAMNILTPKNAEKPVYFLDRQPFDWSLTYGLAAYDLAYILVLWWPTEARQAHEAAMLQRWFEAFAQPGYDWEQAQSDWQLSVEQCLHVPLEWCSKPETVAKMRWVWERQLGRIQTAQNLASS